MRLLVLILAGCLFNVLEPVVCQEFSVIRHSDGDIFTLEGSCTEACTVLSSGTASPYTRSPSSAGLVSPNSTCTCQCNHGLPTFREDLRICVNDIHECKVAGFVSNTGQVEKVPYVFLPQRGQIIYPHAEIRFEGVTTPVCGIAGAQQLGRAGWSELRNLSDTEPPFRLFRDEGRTFLQWIGETGLRDAAEGRVVTAKLVCRDASPQSTLPSVFTPCVAFRVAGSPSKSNVREVMFSSSSQLSQGLSTTEYTAIGLSSLILALIYVASVSLYLHSKRSKRRRAEEPELSLTPGREVCGLVKSNPLLAASRHFESDTNSGLTESDPADDPAASDSEQGFESVTSAIVHPRCVYMEQSEICFGAGTILGERLPEEDVRVVETADNPHQQDVPVLPGAQRRKLYFNPAYFDRQLLIAPPPAAIEFLLKIREVISIAKHKMAAKRFVPTLVGIPEEENDAEQCESAGRNHQQSSANSVQGSVAKSRKSQRCTGCPGCTDSFRNTPALPESEQPSPGESKVRAWLEDVRTTPQRRWRDAEEARRSLQENTRTFSKNLEYLKELAKRDVDPRARSIANPRGLASWRDNPPMLRTFQNVARSEILETDDRHSVSKRSTKSMFEETSRYTFGNSSSENKEYSVGGNGDEAMNAKVRRAIENSFMKQLEENAELEKESAQKQRDKGDDLDELEHADEEGKDARVSRDEKRVQEARTRTRATTDDCARRAAKKKQLPDMINELPNSKNTAKRIMDAVIREMVDAKVLEQHSKSTHAGEYEVDSLERSKCSRKSSASPVSTDQSSPALSTALPMDEELTMRNAVINTRTGEMILGPGAERPGPGILERNCYNSLPELVSSQRSESYSLVSEVYVNDGYDSPACSDDSGPEIRYEPENPGHLTIKVQDSPDNYVKQDESEYEPDTLDRKPMKLRINELSEYREKDDPDPVAEVYVDSLERPAQILLKSKGSFRDQDASKESPAPRRGYGSLREIYEARLKSSASKENVAGKTVPDEVDESDGSWRRCKYLTPETRQLKRQRQPSNRPDVVPPPPAEAIYQQPKPPRRVKDERLAPAGSLTKNGWGRSPAGAGDPTASNGAPVPSDQTNVGTIEAAASCPSPESQLGCGHRSDWFRNGSRFKANVPGANACWSSCRGQKGKERRRFGESRQESENRRHSEPCRKHPAKDFGRAIANGTNRFAAFPSQARGKVEDSGYLSSTDSTGSQKRLLGHEVSSVSETDETESVCDGASESGAESIGTDSVFFGNFRSLAENSSFTKSVDSGVEMTANGSASIVRSLCTRNENAAMEKGNFSTSDSETESFVTVLPPAASRTPI